MKRTIILLSLVFALVNAKAQQTQTKNLYPVVGQPCPEFVLHHIKYYPKTAAALKDFKGKWLMLDLFTSSCGACIASFPHITADAKQFGGKLTYMMVGAPDESIGPLYERFRDKLQMPMPCAFDHGLFEKWGVHAVPRVYLIDDKGIVRSISTGLTTGQLKNFIDGKGDQTAKQTYSTPDSTIIYGSAFSKYNPKIERFTDPATIARDYNTTTFACKGADLSSMLNYAFWGDMYPAGYHPGVDSSFYRYSNNPVIATQDSALFKYSTRENRNVFDYLLKLKGNVPDSMLRATMRADLCRYFGWQVNVETRQQACWALVATDEARQRLQSKGVKLMTNGDFNTDLTAKNFPFDKFFGMICDQQHNTIILDRTGITGNIDFMVKGPWFTLADVQAGIKPLGLSLVPAITEARELIVKDRTGEYINSTWPKPLQFAHMDWQQGLHKAQTENKLVMVYCFDPANAGCQWMNQDVLPAEVVGDYLATKVVALKYDLSDQTDTTAQQLKLRYHLHKYPAILFFAPTGKPLDIETGGKNIHDLIDLVAQAGSPRFQYFTHLEAYRAGKTDSASLYDLAREALNKDQPESHELAWAYIRRFILPAAAAVRWNADNCGLLISEINANADTGVINLIYANRRDIDEVNHDPQKAEDLVRGFVIRQQVYGPGNQPDWQQIIKEFNNSYPAIDYHRELLETQLSWSLDHADWKAYQSYMKQFMAQYQSQLSPSDINDKCYNIFLHCDDPALLQNAVIWAGKALKDSNNSPDVLDTYAELLYKTKSKLNYLAMEQQVAEAKPDDEDIQANYVKMKKGEATWDR